MTRPRDRPLSKQFPDQEGYTGHCDPCGKWLWESRRAARQAAARRFPGDRMSAYRCPEGSLGYQFGHLPAEVRAGAETRSEARVRLRWRRSA